MQPYTIQYDFRYGNFGFNNSITLLAESPDRALEAAKQEVYTSNRVKPKHVRRWSFKHVQLYVSPTNYPVIEWLKLNPQFNA